MVYAQRQRVTGHHSAANSRDLWTELYPNTSPAPPVNLPACAQRLRVFVYHLSFPNVKGAATSQSAMLDRIEKRRGNSSCDFARSACFETRASNTGGGVDYSNVRQYAAEVPLLAKLLLLPPARHASDADLFVVPWLTSTEQFAIEDGAWNSMATESNRRSRLVRSQLAHYGRGLERRHLFLASRDLVFVPSDLRQEVQRSGAMLLHYGPRRPNRTSNHFGGHILVAPNSAGFGAPLAPLEHPARHFLFAMMDEKLNVQRRKLGPVLRLLNASRPDVHYFPIGDHRTMSLSPAAAHRLMTSSLLCPIIQGDLPYQHRLFDAIATGCVPLLFAYTTHFDGRPCEAWSWDPATARRALWGFPQNRVQACCIEHTLPYHRVSSRGAHVHRARKV